MSYIALVGTHTKLIGTCFFVVLAWISESFDPIYIAGEKFTGKCKCVLFDSCQLTCVFNSLLLLRLHCDFYRRLMRLITVERDIATFTYLLPRRKRFFLFIIMHMKILKFVVQMYILITRISFGTCLDPSFCTLQLLY